MNDESRILIVDDSRPVLDSLRVLLQQEFNDVLTLRDPGRLLATAINKDVDVILLDMNFSSGRQTGQEGIFWLTQVRESLPHVSVVFITAFGDVELAVQALKRGATDFVLKPWSNDKLLEAIKSACKIAHSKKKINTANAQNEQADKERVVEIVGRSVALKSLLNMVDKVARTDANILILGENGTGKELIASLIHQKSARRDKRLVTVDLGAIPHELFESELFGHIKGSFTDAKEDRIGKFEAAHGGTLLLDEIGNLPLSLQPKLLATLQNREVYPLGSNKARKVDIRLIVATNRDLENMVDEGKFREDLFFRINTIVMRSPPLRDRGGDILLLSEYFLAFYSHKYRVICPRLNDKAKEKLMAYNWPGNVRELQHSMEKAVILNDGPDLGPESFEFRSVLQARPDTSNLTLEQMEEIMIRQAIDRCQGNMSAAAEQLGITRQTLYNKLKK